MRPGNCRAQELPSAWQVLPSHWQSAKTRIQVQALLDRLDIIYLKYCGFSVSEGNSSVGVLIIILTHFT